MFYYCGHSVVPVIGVLRLTLTMYVILALHLRGWLLTYIAYNSGDDTSRMAVNIIMYGLRNVVLVMLRVIDSRDNLIMTKLLSFGNGKGTK
jgi:hypothetical protein